MFKVGDRIRVTKGELQGKVGEIIVKYKADNFFDVRVHIDGEPIGQYRVFQDDQLGRESS